MFSVSARAVALSLVVGSTTLFAQTEQRTIRGQSVAVYNLAGRVRAVAGDGDAVVVSVTRVGADAARLRIETGAIGGTETLRIVYPDGNLVYDSGNWRGRTSLYVRDDGTFGDGGWDDRDNRRRIDVRGSGSGMEAHADLEVRVPRGQRIALYLGVGRMEVSNVEGSVYVDVAAADVDVAGVRGALSLDTGSGRIAVRDVTGNLDIDSGSGGMTIERARGTTLRLDSGSGGVSANEIEMSEIEADVGSGGLRMYRTKGSRISAETGSGGIELDLISDIEMLDVETGSGGVTIRAPAALSAEVDAETGSGGFHTDFEIVTRRVSRNHVAGRIGAGKARVRIEAGSGPVRLLKN